MGCGQIRDQGELTRLALDGGAVVADLGRRLPGRGAYVCGRTCLEAAVARRALARAFKRPLSIAPDFVDSLELHG